MIASTVQELDACMSKHGVLASAVHTRLAKCLAVLPIATRKVHAYRTLPITVIAGTSETSSSFRPLIIRSTPCVGAAPLEIEVTQKVAVRYLEALIELRSDMSAGSWLAS